MCLLPLGRKQCVRKYSALVYPGRAGIFPKSSSPPSVSGVGWGAASVSRAEAEGIGADTVKVLMDCAANTSVCLVLKKNLPCERGDCLIITVLRFG